jgi:hypothetical protein
VSAASALDASRKRSMYVRAVAHGVANTQCSVERERGYGALRLLTLATLRLPDLAVYGELLHSHAEEASVACLVAQTLIGASAGAMRLAHRALEMHAVEVGYRVEAWVERALAVTSEQLQPGEELADGLPLALDQARRATIALTRATASTANDPMLVPGQLADALAHLLAIYLVAVEVVAGA